MTNPFTPTFGVTPPLLVGRGNVLDEFSLARADRRGRILDLQALDGRQTDAGEDATP